MSSEKCNVVLLVLDSVRKDHMSCYGYERETTPNCDRIASQGIRFTRATAASCWTIPSHASLFTGLYPSQHGVDLDTAYLGAGTPTLASYLTSRGYATGSISCNGFITERTNLTHGFELSIDAVRLRGRGRWVGRLVRPFHRRWQRWTARDRGARHATKLALKWLRRRSDEGRPFFLFMNYMDCHLPYRLKGEPRYRFLAESERARADSVPQDPFAVMARRAEMTPQDLDYLQALYDGCLRYLDDHVGVVDAALHELGLADDTLFIVTSDHGESFGEHGLLDHQYGLYEPLLSVPLVFRLPGQADAGAVSDQLVQHVDILATVADVIGGEIPFDHSGVSVFEASQRDVSLAEYLVPNVKAIRRRFPEADVSRFDVPLRSISTAHHKLIARQDGTVELYDLVADPNEERNIAIAEPELVSRLGERMSELLGGWPQAGGEGRSLDEMDEMRDRLRALGYI